MNRIELLGKIEKIGEDLANYDVSDIYSEVDDLFDELEAKDKEISSLKDDVESLKEDVESLEEQVLELENKNPVEFENNIHNNIRTQSAYESLLKNVDYIPIDALENFINQHAKI